MFVRACLTANLGDSLNGELVKLISGEAPFLVNNQYEPIAENIYMVIGSILGWSTHSTIVWGSGFIKEGQKIKTPKQILAVRGELTREELLKQGIKCPKVYGDPALLMPRFYNPKLKKKYHTSIILHHIDKPLKDVLKKQFPLIHFIDIQKPVYEVINEILQSENIISSALHGLIIADAYNIPNIWMKVSDNIIGNDFKFYDYFSSTKREDKVPLIVNEKTHIGMFTNKLKYYKPIEINLDKLMKVCPFKNG